MDNCFGYTTCLLSRLKEFDKKKWNYVFDDLNKEPIELVFNNKHKVTDFFNLEIKNELFENFILSDTDYDLYRQDILDKLIASKDFKPFSKIAYLPNDEELMDNYSRTSFIMKKVNHFEVIKNDFELSSVFMISTRKNKNIYLAFINKVDNHFEIIPFYNVIEQRIVPDYPYKTKDGQFKTFQPIELIENPAKLPKPLSIDDIEIMAKTLIIYDPNCNLDFYGESPF